MDNILKDLYFGRYAAFERKVEPSSSHADAIDKVVELEEALMNDLPSELLPRFRTYSNAVADLASITAEEDFEEGVRLGIRIMMAAFPKELGDTPLPPSRRGNSIHYMPTNRVFISPRVLIPQGRKQTPG